MRTQTRARAAPDWWMGTRYRPAGDVFDGFDECVRWRRGLSDSDIRLDIKEVLFFPAMKPDTTQTAPGEKVRTGLWSTERVTDPLFVNQAAA
jgi:hypothetical protein